MLEFEEVTDDCLKEIDFYRDISWQDDPQYIFPRNATDESFLLEYDMARIARKFDSGDAGFKFNFDQDFATADDKEKAAICGNCKKWKGRRSLKDKVSKGTSTSGLGNLDLDDPCQCGEDCECDCASAMTPWK